MKRIKFLFAILAIFVLCGCGAKTNNTDVINKFEKKVNSVKSYGITGKMEITSNEETYTYDVKVDYKYDNLYKVTLTNTINNHEQVILKNKDGVYVVTPALNKSFKFQSEWPDNSSQSYLLSSLVKDMKNTKDITVDTDGDYYIVNADVNYPNNSSLTKEKIYFDKDNNLKEVQVLNKDNNAVIKMKFTKIEYNAKFKDDNFNLDSLITKNECKGEEDCTSNKDKASNILDSVVYPLYLPADTHLSTKDTIDTGTSDRIIMTYAGAKPFMIIEETAKSSKEMEITSVSGEPLLLSMGVGILSANSLEWNAGKVDYYITSSYLTSEELMTIAESLNTATVVEINEK